MSSQDKNEILFAINNFYEQINQKISEVKDELTQNISEVKDELTQNISEVKNELNKNISDFKEETNQRFEKIEMQIKGLQNETKELKEETRKISRSVAVIEAEHGEKISILFDAITTVIQKQDEFEKRMEIDEIKIEKNQDNIYLLNSKIQKI